jgi:hypothetical protein
MKKRLGLLMLFFLPVSLNILLLPHVLPAQEGNIIKEVTNSALFIYDPSASPCDEVPRPVSQRKMLRPIGSGFIVGLRPPVTASASEKTEMRKFLITAEHVIGKRNAVIVRLNRNLIELQSEPGLSTAPLLFFKVPSCVKAGTGHFSIVLLSPIS